MLDARSWTSPFAAQSAPPAHLEVKRTRGTLAEDAFKAVARYADALNQGRAKAGLEPFYASAAALLTFDDVPLSKALQQHEYPADLYAPYRHTSRKTQYFIEDWDFAAAKPELLSAHQRRMLHTAALGETSG